MKRLIAILVCLVLVQAAHAADNGIASVVSKSAPGFDFAKSADVFLIATVKESHDVKNLSTGQTVKMEASYNLGVTKSTLNGGFRVDIDNHSVGQPDKGDLWYAEKGTVKDGPDQILSLGRLYAAVVDVCSLAPLARLKPDAKGVQEAVDIDGKKIDALRFNLGNICGMDTDVLIDATENRLLAAEFKSYPTGAFVTFSGFPEHHGGIAVPREWSISHKAGEKPWGKVSVAQVLVLRSMPAGAYAKEKAGDSLARMAAVQSTKPIPEEDLKKIKPWSAELRAEFMAHIQRSQAVEKMPAGPEKDKAGAELDEEMKVLLSKMRAAQTGS
jgi:hypothetical protein